MSFRLRTAMVVLVLTALTMGSAFGGVWWHFVSEQRRQLDEALLQVAHREASEVAAGELEFGDAPGPSANAVGPLPKYGVVYGINGLALAHTPNFRSIPPMPRLVPFEIGYDFDHDGIPMRGVVVGVAGTGRRVLLATPRLDFEEDASILGRAMTLAFGAGCLWAAAVALGIASRLTREHRSIADVARRVASGDPSARIELRSSDADLRQLADDVNEMISQLVGLLAVQDRFIAHAAHELRTPLASLRIELEHALRSGRERSDFEAALRGALESTQRLTALAEDLLQLARTKARPTDEVTALEDALADAVADVAPLGRSRSVFIVSEPLAATVHGDRRSIARILRNVIENAVRFSPPHGRVHVEPRIVEERVVVRVTDSGPGVEADDVERIFEPFTRGVRDEATEGSGLGLAIARSLARAVDGDVRAEPVGGGHFVVALRVAER